MSATQKARLIHWTLQAVLALTFIAVLYAWKVEARQGATVQNTYHVR